MTHKMYTILKDDYDRKWVDSEKDLAAWTDTRSQRSRLRGNGEDEKQYQIRLERWKNVPVTRTHRQAQWLHCAIIASRALDYISYYRKAYVESGYDPYSLDQYYFSPFQFAEFMWICLLEGINDEYCPTPKYLQRLEMESEKMLSEVIECWELGT